MKRVLIYSDCNLFGGSEHAVINLLKNEEIKKHVSFSFAYRYYESYKAKINELLSGQDDIIFYPIRLLTNYSIYDYIKDHTKSKPIYRLFFAPFYYCEKLGVYDYLNRIKIRRFLRKHPFDIVHINNGGYPGASSCLIMAEEAAKLGMKVALQVNNIASDQINKTTNLAVSKSVDYCITASQVAKNALLNILPIKFEQVLTIPHFVDYVKPKKSRIDLLAPLKISNDSLIIVEVALLQQRKGQVELVRAVKRMMENEKIDVNLILIGNGESKQAIIETINTEGLSGNVHLLGYRDDYIDFIDAADVVTLPSLKDEDMPLTIISALSLGKPIVSTKLAGIPEEIEDGVSGILINPKSETFVQDLSGALYKAYQKREILSSNARKRYDDVFSKEQFTQSYIKLYSSL